MTAIREGPDAIILDVSIPAGSGFQILKCLTGSTKTQHIPVLVVSGSGGEDTRQLVKRLGGADFLQKPLDAQQLCGAVFRLLPLNTYALLTARSRVY